MLFQLGPLTIDSPGPFNATDAGEDFGASYAVKPIVGAAPDREFVGPDDTKRTISGTLFPMFFARNGLGTGLDAIEMLRSMTQSGAPQLLVRGDGTNLGWWLVEHVRQRTKNIGVQGIGREVSYDIELVASSTAASPDQILTTLITLFA